MTPRPEAGVLGDGLATPERIPLEEVYMRFAESLALRGTCRRRHVGAVIACEDLTRVLGIGYNGGAKGLENHCLIMDEPDKPCVTCIHAETNAVAKAGSSGERKWAFVTWSPCLLCATLLINSNVTHVLYRQAYRDLTGVRLLERAGVDARLYDSFSGLWRQPFEEHA